MSQWIYRILPKRPAMIDAPTDEESAVLGERLGYLDALRAAGILILAGSTPQDEGAWTITIFEAPDQARAHAVMHTDPAVAAGVMFAELYPYAVAPTTISAAPVAASTGAAPTGPASAVAASPGPASPGATSAGPASPGADSAIDPSAVAENGVAENRVAD